MNYLEATKFLREGLQDLFGANCEVTLLGSHSEPRKLHAIAKVQHAAWLIGGLEDRSGGRLEVVDALYHARTDEPLTLYKDGCEFAWVRQDPDGARLIAPSAGLTLRIWTEPPSLSLLLDGDGHFNLTKKFGWVLFFPENQREGLLSPA
jgi:hypothetical protein